MLSAGLRMIAVLLHIWIEKFQVFLSCEECELRTNVGILSVLYSAVLGIDNSGSMRVYGGK